MVEGFVVDNHFWLFQDLQKYLNKHRPVDAEDFVSNQLSPYIMKFGKLLVHAGNNCVGVICIIP